MSRIAIIGAGLSGLVLARQLRHSADVTIFEKSRGAGGRMATRYAGQFEFDHGAQFFTARSKAFGEFLQPLIAEGIVAGWPARFVELHGNAVTTQRRWDDSYPHYVGTPRMNSIGNHLTDGLDVHRDTRVASMSHGGSNWQLQSADARDLGNFDWVVFTAPAAQTAALFPANGDLQTIANSASMRACFVAMLGFDAPLQVGWDAAQICDSDISWVSVNSSKPGRDDAFTLVVHSTNAWADANLNLPEQTVLEHLVQQTSRVIGHDADAASHRQLQRWRYANIDGQSGPRSFIDPERKLAACGDWFIRGRVEAAFSSANDLAAKMQTLL